MLALKGTGVALVTPFDTEHRVDYDGLTAVIEHVLAGKADYLVVLGTTGETATLSKQEKKRVLRHAIAANAGRKPIVYGLGGNHTAALLHEIKETDFTGVDAVLSVSPYYNKPSQAGIIAHYQQLADACPVPIILYNVPGRTMSNMEAATTLTLAQHPNIIGMKEASGNLEQCMRIAAGRPKDFLLISGDDMLTLPLRALGGDGVISVLANALPEAFYSLCHEEEALAQKALFSLLELNPLMYQESNPVGLKALLSLMGICGPDVRLPLMEASEGLKEAIRTALKKR